MTKRIILASNRLPVNVTEDNGKLQVNRSIGGVATALDAIFRRYDTRWVGWTGLGRIVSPDEMAALNLPERFVPVQAETALVTGYYDHFANQVLWPSLHHFWPTRAPGTRDWEAMQEIARRFAAAIAGVADPEDAIWIHDYHLMMLPQALRKIGVANRIGFFLHTPFATPRYIRAMAHHRELLESLYEVDVLGVQTRREVEQLWEGIREFGGHRQPGLIRAFPIGIDYDAHVAHGQREAVQQLAAAIRQEYAGKRIIFSVSRLDYTKGILTQLEAVERFLIETPDRERYVYKLIVAPSRESVKAYAELQRAVHGKVAAVNARHGTPGWQPVQYVYENHGLDQMAAWYSVADALVLTPVIDGMNLIVKEYIAVRPEPGAIVLSTGAGAAAQLHDALTVPSGDPAAAAEALHRAFAMGEGERRERWVRLQQNVCQQNVFWWADTFIAALQKE